MALSLTFACGPYDRIEPLRTGEVKPEGIDLDVIAIQRPPDIFDRMIDGHEFDVAEMGSSRHVSMLASGKDWPFVGIPVFPSKSFRHGYAFVNRQSGITAPKDLEGKRVGVRLYGQTANIWIRGFLKDDYGVDLDAVHWVRGGLARADGPEDNSMRGMAGAVEIEYIGTDRTLDAMLCAGEIDAYIGAEKPPSFGKHPDIARLFPDVRAVEQDFYARTHIHPIMHLVVIREDLYREQPWIAASLYRAFDDAKNAALQAMRFSGAQRYMLPWLYADLDEVDALFGGDPWPYGIGPNRQSLEALIRHMVDQRFIAKSIAVEDMFVPVGTS